MIESFYSLCLFGKNDEVKKRLGNGEEKKGEDRGKGIIGAVCGGNVKTLRILLNHNFDVNVKDEKTGKTPLIIACERGYFQIVEELILSRKCDLNVHDKVNQYTAIFYSIINQHINISYELIGSGCEIDTLDCFGNTVLHCAVTGGSPELFENIVRKVPKSIRMKVLLHENNDGDTVYHLACALGKIYELEYLLKFMSPTELYYLTNSNGDSLAHVCAYYGKRRCLEKILKKFPDQGKRKVEIKIHENIHDERSEEMNI